MPKRPWRPGEAITVGTPEDEWMLKGAEIVNSETVRHLHYSGLIQALIDHPQWATEYDPETRKALAAETVHLAYNARFPRIQLPPLSDDFKDETENNESASSKFHTL